MNIDVLYATGDIVSAYVRGNPVPPEHVPDIIRSVRRTLAVLSGAAEDLPPSNTQKPAVSVRSSVSRDYIVCLEDGRRMKTLRRHLGLLGMTPDEYRQKWGLPPDYPMTAPNYSKQRSELAKRLGLGTKTHRTRHPR